MRLPLIGALCACLVSAQAPRSARGEGPAGTPPEIRGTVLEVGPDTGLAGAEVTLTEFVSVDNDLQPRVFGTVFTDPRGAFSFKPNHLGDFRLNVKKAGYTDASGDGERGEYLVLRPEQPVQQFVFRLLNPASFRGRVVDEDGKPTGGFPIGFMHTTFPGTGEEVRTDQDGVFTATNLMPGPYLVRVAPKAGAFALMADFTEEDFKIVDHDVAVSYWPGDVPDPSAALPLTLAPGQQASMGTITLRKTDYYRVHVSVSSPCVDGEMWWYALFRPEEKDEGQRLSPASCGKDFILRNVERGSYVLAIWNMKEAGDLRWAISPVEVNGRNAAVELAMSPGTEVAGRIVVPDGVARPSLNSKNVVLQPETTGLRVVNTFFSSDADGRFLTGRLPWARYRVSLVALPRSHYIKEIRYNGVPVPDGVVTLFPGAALEILLDDHPATLSGTITDGDKPAADATVILRKWPIAAGGSDEISLNPFTARSDEEGNFQFGGLAPGEYQIETLSPDPYRSPKLSRPMPTGERIKLERDDRKTVQLKLVRP